MKRQRRRLARRRGWRHPVDPQPDDDRLNDGQESPREPPETVVYGRIGPYLPDRGAGPGVETRTLPRCYEARPDRERSR
jgi:hypothetical protein